ncbi:hypothetical protein EMIHUDRAFT_111477 [Emiliania huxleyi CCMP1516]|uniref:tRNA (guanine(9)-N(1))-methyltransferase n=2 Tax=Emiliania huxleyi TaxID=2903 RepID=A0A0D3KDV2_EMIH1|nr:hypothetical protein EMIHUDRAFT_111477 [Emiliania huxleyi CCMP1516]EOD33937.1 hypothetical protein EMIHUDRAFT_111477 [Emiliania huxleyi CCMP1516]|eukprot:XP_005786366.1 hypothetical protein EMIHUDRAFT_111477 [Emiliania huxleyi CCMP1516]
MESPAVPRYAPPPGFVRKTKAEKRELKAAKMRELRGEWRRREREGRRKQVAQRAAERGAMLERMSEEERADFWRAERAEKERLEQEKREQNERLDAALSDGVRVVVDLSYGATMNLKEQRSLARQLGRCWGANRRAPAPVALHLASMQRCPAPCLPQDGDHKRWKVRLLDEDLEHHFSPSDLVFLSPDADEALTCVDKSKVYVIGGLVDVSVQKRSSLTRARELGATAVRLPLREHVADVANRRQPLTLPAVLEMLLHVNATGDWLAAIEAALPARNHTRPPELSRSGRRKGKRARLEAQASGAEASGPSSSGPSSSGPSSSGPSSSGAAEGAAAEGAAAEGLSGAAREGGSREGDSGEGDSGEGGDSSSDDSSGEDGGAEGASEGAGEGRACQA